ncbi:hypothetical protein OG365_03830 [Streptomyces sp. NBC_00853]|uniref:hypothetical protein n=1 Tax=Streptomyces sp. NBC_00853 TaxID=2903681 RepID=UPI0038738BD7|nr:hypothetical protein OG365_03830 [Streptomyces sp. NBC_00853]
MLKRYVIALSVTAAALLLPAGAAQAADGIPDATTVTTTTGGENTTTTQTPRQIVTPSGRVVTVGTTTNGRLRDINDSSWGG